MTQAAEVAARLADRFEGYRVGFLSDLAQVAAIPDPTPPKPEFVLGQTDPKGRVGLLGPITKTVNEVARVTTTSPIYDTHFKNWVDPVAPVGNYINCRFSGPAAYSTARPLVKHTASSVVQSKFTHCTFDAQTPGADEVDGIVGFNYWLDRCDIHHVDDGFGVFAPGNVVVTGSWVHDLVWFAKAKQADGTHNDCVQVHNGGRLTLIGSRLDAYLADDAGDPRTQRTAMSAGMLSPAKATGGTLDLLIADNWVTGGQVAFNFAAWTNPSGERRLVGNRYGTDVTTPVLAKSVLPLTLAGNTRDGAAFDIRKNG